MMPATEGEDLGNVSTQRITDQKRSTTF